MNWLRKPQRRRRRRRLQRRRGGREAGAEPTGGDASRNFCSIFQAADAKSLMRATAGRTMVLQAPCSSSTSSCSAMPEYMQWLQPEFVRGDKSYPAPGILRTHWSHLTYSQPPRQILNARQTNNRPLFHSAASEHRRTDTPQRRWRRQHHHNRRRTLYRAHPVAEQKKRLPPSLSGRRTNEFPPPPNEHLSNMITG